MRLRAGAELYNLGNGDPVFTRALEFRMLPFRISNVIIAISFADAVGSAYAESAGASEEDIARPLLTQALENQFHGRYQATVEMIHDDFAAGKDSLAGYAEFADDLGERKLCLAGPRKAFEYKSLNFGKEQWITDEETHRVRRIANRQWKKGVFGTLLTYEDMLKLPADFFLEYSACKSLRITDSTYQISMTLKPIYQSFYSRLDVELSKHPVLVKTMVFYGTHGERLKTLAVKGYKELEGKWLATDLGLADNDSLSSLRMCFKNFSFSEPAAARKDHARLSLMEKQPLALPAGTEGSAGEESADEGSNEARN
jgi:hypothetical protein